MFEIDSDGFVAGLGLLEAELEQNMGTALANALNAIASTAKELAPEDTSLLKTSIQPLPISGSYIAGTLEGFVEAGAPYALAVEEGTQPHEIRPRFRRSLRFPVEGGFVFARVVQHPGTAPQPFMEPALRQETPDILAEFEAALDLSFHRAGF